MATKKAAAKKAPAKKAAAKAAGTTKEDRDERDSKRMEKVVKLRDSGKNWSEISETMGVTPGKAIDLYNRATVKKADRITGETDKELGQAIVRARETDLLSWGLIAARAGIGEARARSLYATYSKNPEKGARIGKGGRYVGDVKPGDSGAKAKPVKSTAKKAPVKAAAKKAPAKKAVAKKAAAKGATSPGKSHPLEGKSKAELAEKLEGKIVTLGKISGVERDVHVDTIKKLVGNTVTVLDMGGKTHELDILDMAGASKAE